MDMTSKNEHCKKHKRFSVCCMECRKINSPYEITKMCFIPNGMEELHKETISKKLHYPYGDD